MWFCCSDCHRINSALQKLVAHGEQELPDSLLNAIRKKQNEDNSENEGRVEVKWRVLNGKITSDEETKLLSSKILSIFHVSNYWFMCLRYFVILCINQTRSHWI